MSIRPFVFFGLAAAAVTAPAFANTASPLEVASKIFVEQKSVAADGTVRTALVPANRTVPGDRIVFVLAYRNTGAQSLGNLVFDNPLPAGVAYRAPAAGSVAPELSVDGKTYGTLGSLRMPVAGGGTRPATNADVTHVRWRLAGSLAAGGKGQFAFQATLK